jgi:hypothetical protein
MLVSGNYEAVQLNYQPFWEKPPFFIWLQAASMNIFGVNEFAARFPNSICAIATLVTLYIAGTKFHSQKFGIMWTLIYAGMLLPHLYFKSGIIDPWFNLFIFLSLYQFILVANNPSGRSELVRAALGGIFLGLAVLTKGPAALVIVALTILFHFVMKKDGSIFVKRTFLVYVISTLVVSLSWFSVEWARGHGDVIKEFVNYQVRLFQTGDAGHEGPFYYHVLVLLIGCFPASLLFIQFYRQKEGLTPFQLLFRKMVLNLFWVVLILFSIVKTKIVHYSSLCYIPLTFIAALAVVQYIGKVKFISVLKTLFWTIAIIISALFTFIPFINSYKNAIIRSGLVKDEIALENMKAQVNWGGWEFLTGLFFLLASYFIFRAIQHGKIKIVYTALICYMISISLAIFSIIPKVESYTQHAAIAFYKACAKNDCYIETHRFKSYAYLFYSERKPSDFSNPDLQRTIKEKLDEAEADGHLRYPFFASANVHWIKLGKIDKPGYIVARKSEEQEMLDMPQFKKLYELNGFCFFVKMPNAK